MKQIYGHLLLFIAFVFFLEKVQAQETTATLSGIISDSKGAPLNSASITIKHEPTGYSVSAMSNSKGIVVAPNLKPGGPYTITISFAGLKTEKLENINLSLGSNPDLNIQLTEETKEIKEVIVTGTKKGTGSGLSLGRAQMNVLPTLGRSLGDFTRLTPQSNNNSFAGSNFRYNNLTIDGAVNNDAIGFSNSFGGTSGGGQSGAAGAGTRTNPYSIDVIQEVQVQLAPYDVKLGNFTGGSVNAVTKSGTNDFHGSVYAYGRNQSLIGKSVDGLKTKIGSDFYDYQWGATLGGPIIKNKAFFIVNYENTRRQEPTFYNAGEKGSAITIADATAIANKLITRYGYDPGSYLGAYKIFTNSDKLFARLDFKVGSKSNLTLRTIYTVGKGNNLERSSTNFQFGNTDFTQTTKNLNVVAELKTKISNNLSNQFTASFINVHEFRTFPSTLAPFIDIDNGRIWAGTWREASIYNMKQRTLELTDNVTLTKGIHKFTFGTHNEFYDITYGFINSWNGRWEYNRGVNSFLNDNPSRIRGAYIRDPKLANDRQAIFNDPPNPYKVALLSVYTQDEITVSKKFKVTPGIRLDYSHAGNQPGLDSNFTATVQNSQAAPSYSATRFSNIQNKWLGNLTVSPRLGFNYDVKGNGKLVVRGGTGIFVGRIPFAWMGYSYTLNGSTYGNIDWNGPSATTTVPLAINPLFLRDTVTKYGGAAQSARREVDVIDNKFKLPTVWRSNVAVDVKFGKGYKFTADFLYTQTIYDIKFQQINLFDSTQYFTSGGPTQTPVFVGRSGANGRYNNVYSNVFMLTNTNRGYRYNITGQLSKSTTLNNYSINWSLAYTYGYSKDLSNGIRNSWESNYSVNPAINPNSPQLSFSNFDLRHRIVGVLSNTYKWNAMNATSLTFFYSGQSGNPYTPVYVGNPGNGGNSSPLPYIPKDRNDIRLVDYTLNGQLYTADQQWNDLNNLISNDKYLNSRRGQYAERNGMRTPWVHQLDLKILHEFKLSKSNHQKSLQLSLDIFNVLNLINNSWGHINFVTNVNNYTVNLLRFAAYSLDANGNPVAVGTPGSVAGKSAGTPASGYIPTFTFFKPTGVDGNKYYTTDPINSRWQGQLGIKYNF
ncbi:MAG: carboxypeptidase regulatory-like domain-containing protein [Chitinophagaceae bacterium]|nr:carboxypeptidase regulatory-like domain-containing protein [Chitinophagaceae bacterium]